jgi:transcriptional regulator with XRE-family HTH domain
MRKRGVTRAELSEATGVSISAIARWLAGRGHPPRVDVAARIATVLKTTPGKLFTPSVATPSE